MDRRRAERPSRRTLAAAIAAVLPLLVGLASSGLAEPVRLSLPVACDIGKTCFVQHYLDIDAGPGARDHACGNATYDGHDGVDFRLLSAAAARAGVNVLAAADGTVLRVRDGMPDAIAREAGGRSALSNRECGNGLVIDHGGGLETQYCHLLHGSLLPRPGDRVVRGAPVGRIGYSGLADFAHLHFTVRRAGRILDPFAGGIPDGTCRLDRAATTDGASLWDPATARSLAYRPVEIIQVAMAGGPPNLARLERDHAAYPPARADAPALVVFARIMNLKAGDRIRLRLTGPDGAGEPHTAAPLDRNKAIYIAFAGRRRSAAAWPRGTYGGLVEVLRGDTVIASATASQQLE